MVLRGVLVKFFHIHQHRHVYPINRLEPAGLRQGSAPVGNQQQRDQADHVKRPPAIGQVLDKSEHECSETRADPLQCTQGTDTPSTVLGSELFGYHHRRNEHLRRTESAREQLADHKGFRSGRYRGGTRKQRVADHRHQQKQSATVAVRSDRKKDRKKRPASDDGPQQTKIRFRYGQLFLNLFQIQRKKVHVVLLKK